MKFFGKIVTRQHSKQFALQLRMLKILLFADLRADYEGDFPPKLADALAASVVDYLTGGDLDLSYASVDEETKSRIRQIRDQVVPRADEKMLQDKTVRETIVYTHRMKAVLTFGSDNDSYFETNDFARSEEILSKYGAEFPRTLTPKLYGELFDRFRLAKEQFIPRAT